MQCSTTYQGYLRIMKQVYPSEETLQTIFVASCVESAAIATGCESNEMYQRMKRVGLLEDYIWRFYDTLHTQSREYVTSDVLETLVAWEKRKGGVG